MKKHVLELFEKEEVFNKGKQLYISNLSNNTKSINQGSLFFAVKGTNLDGHDFVEEAVKNGAVCIVVEKKEVALILKNRYPHITTIITDNVRKKQAVVSQKFYDFPDKNLKIIGITGTNGKTSTANITAQYIKQFGLKVATIGTIGYEFEGKYFGNGMTTPDSITWYRLLKEFKNMGAEYVVSEISSHAVDQYRFYGTTFTGGIFTNLSQDHLDYHASMENYFLSKKRFIDYVLETSKDSVVSINTSCLYGKRMYDQCKYKDRVITYGFNTGDVKVIDANLDIKGTGISYLYKGKTGSIKVNLLGEFNIFNVIASFSLLLKLGFDKKDLERFSQNIKPVKGRFEIVSNNGFLVINDYAHTPDALEKILISLNRFKKRRIISVFGAGGDRDKTKRPVMGKVAQEYSDLIILTSDNPRSEKPENIIQDILKGITKKEKVMIIIDREEAIKKAIQLAQEEDIVLIAGKGHENYQIVGNTVYKFDDSDIAMKYIKKIK